MKFSYPFKPFIQIEQILILLFLSESYKDIIFL